MSSIDVLPAKSSEFAEHRSKSLVWRGETARGHLGLCEDVAPDILHEKGVVVSRALYNGELAFPQIVAVGVLFV